MFNKLFHQYPPFVLFLSAADSLLVQSPFTEIILDLSNLMSSNVDIYEGLKKQTEA